MRKTQLRLYAVRLLGACLMMTTLHACQRYGADDAVAATTDPETAMKAIALDRTANADAVGAARDQCANIGGVLEQAGRMGRYACYAQYADAGTSCNDSSECSGDCRAEPDATTGQIAKGVCTANNNPFGCHARVENGVVGSFICVD